MRRREFLKTLLRSQQQLKWAGNAHGLVRAHNWGKYDFGSGPQVTDRLNQGPFPQFPPDAAIPSDEVVMTTTPSEEVVPELWQGFGHVHYCGHGNGRRSSPTTFRKRSKN